MSEQRSFPKLNVRLREINDDSFQINDEILQANQNLHENNLKVLSKLSFVNDVKHVESNNYAVDL